ncbi:TIGR04197 family type VII secretion effector [Streptococcus acidominimus]|uniref:TIGR04197 family type VII secretion effector n=1 Tax=Streptococcus acidominimus TaxID=1326 RepID=A0A4Y9FJW6_STRAI|nr:TIGR04197 family type VII secretion effector [Streptococcus acidominimus]MBF0819753.1 TIGR04197 family type VII secretion effector [Streptococcus acidominimus]MBF0839257.1 TIGR04197 family type VII secretion effector [Streptococcus acidominimus]MBF0847599.1 TIGR04197 family type VII secretion effector [Streptococcus danieliae]TFU29495.1 TIGR04197 family type VII secretion effector [Streptococcus acidominimus]
MYGVIQLSDVVFLSHVSKFSTAKASLADGSKPVFEMTSESKVLDLYQQQFDDLYQLITQYTTLLETDIARISDAGKELTRTDNVLGKSLFSGLN